MCWEPLKVSPAIICKNCKNNGAKIIILNKDPTPMDDYADIVINDCLENIYEHEKMELEDLIATFRSYRS